MATEDSCQVGICLTQVAPICSMRGWRKNTPGILTELESNFSTEEACRAYLVRLRWPDGFRCPRCGHGRSWPVTRVLLEVRELRRANFGDSGNDLPGHPNPFAALVPRHVVGNDAEERSQRVGTATSTGAEKL